MTDVTSKVAEQIEFLRGLRQIRQLKPEPIPADALRDILEVARWTGSARNIQPWELIVIHDRATLQKLGTIPDGRGPHLVNAGAGIALVMSGDLEHPDFDTYDEGRLSERIMLAAEAHELGSAIGWFKGGASDEAKRILGVPSVRLLRTIMSIGVVDAEGYDKRQRPAQPRKSLADIVHQERW
ncbi:MAG: nitroreductase family protein [Chloroflexi bacterium]|nr:nitroreductase family protein [Chloroflexota bacterium]